MNNTFNYQVITHFPQLSGTEKVLRTNDIYQALDTYLNEMQNGNITCIMDGHTGEVMAYANHEGFEDYTKPEFDLIIKGYLATLAAEEEELMVEEEIPTSGYPNNSMVVKVISGEEVVIPLSEKQMDTLMNGIWVSTAYIL